MTWPTIDSSHMLILDLFYPLVSPWKRCLAGALRMFENKEKIQGKNEDVYHFQQADVLCEGGTVSDVMHV